MLVSLARIDCANIKDWDSFHDEFNRVFEFPDFYGRNMDAWIDCMTSIDTPDDGLSGIHCERGGFLTIELDNVNTLNGDRSEYFEAITDCTAFVNWRRIENGGKPVLSLSYYRDDD